MNKLILIFFAVAILDGTTTKIDVDTGKSKVYWKGTKMARTGFHEGTLLLRSGQIILIDGKVTGGKVAIDMQSLAVTDIPVREPVPRNALTNHLKEEFETSRYPTAVFEIQGTKGNLISGKMTVMGRSSVISIPYEKNTNGYSTTFGISREKWGIGKKASWLEKRLVDDNIELKIFIVKK